MAVYIGLAYVAARFIPAGELRGNEMAMVDNALWGPVIIAGIMGATLSSALGSMVGSPRVLQALAAQKVIPFNRFFSAKTKTDEPRNAIAFTGGVILVALLLGNLDYLASLITMFFLITYGMLNLVVFIQQSMGIISFRPTFAIPHFVPFLGAAGCLVVMFLINPAFSAVAIIVTIGLYAWLTRMQLKAESGDIRGGLLLVLAERAARLAKRYPRHTVAWKPDLLLPVENPRLWSGPMHFIGSVVKPAGSVFGFTVKGSRTKETKKHLDELLSPLQKEGILAHSAVIEETDFVRCAKLVIQTLRGGSFRPNILFMTIGDDEEKDGRISELVNEASKNEMGVMILRQHARVAFGNQKTVNLWLRDKSPNLHLAVLLALQLQMNWEGRINLIMATAEKKERARLRRFLERVDELARLPANTDLYVLVGSFEDALEDAPPADISVFGLPVRKIPFDVVRGSTDLTRSTCVFVKDSGHEDALA
jgi:hypothetical protein